MNLYPNAWAEQTSTQKMIVRDRGALCGEDNHKRDFVLAVRYKTEVN
jgi:hypothetical protein